jgi:hypothetical protein
LDSAETLAGVDAHCVSIDDPRCSSRCCRSWAAASSRPTPCPQACGNSPQYQPFTPVTDTVRHLLIGGPVAHSAIVAIAWSLGITVVAYLWAIRLCERRPLR